jgi:uncharacterized protein (DUF2235 family)
MNCSFFIFIFGFSRGAFAARVLANRFVARLGVILIRDGALRDAMKAHETGNLDTFKVQKIKPDEKFDREREVIIPRA